MKINASKRKGVSMKTLLMDYACLPAYGRVEKVFTSIPMLIFMNPV